MKVRVCNRVSLLSPTLTKLAQWIEREKKKKKAVSGIFLKRSSLTHSRFYKETARHGKFTWKRDFV